MEKCFLSTNHPSCVVVVVAIGSHGGKYLFVKLFLGQF
jgi:hypothetical protein